MISKFSKLTFKTIQTEGGGGARARWGGAIPPLFSKPI